MLGLLNHVAIAVKDAEKAARIYGAAFGADISKAVPLPRDVQFSSLPFSRSTSATMFSCFEVPGIPRARTFPPEPKARQEAEY